MVTNLRSSIDSQLFIVRKKVEQNLHFNLEIFKNLCKYVKKRKNLSIFAERSLIEI